MSVETDHREIIAKLARLTALDAKSPSNEYRENMRDLLHELLQQCEEQTDRNIELENRCNELDQECIEKDEVRIICSSFSDLLDYFNMVT